MHEKKHRGSQDLGQRKSYLITMKAISKNTRSSKGQVALEYILLLVVAVGIALFLTRSLVYRSADEPGMIIKAWHSITEAIGSDTADMPTHPEEE